MELYITISLNFTTIKLQHGHWICYTCAYQKIIFYFWWWLQLEHFSPRFLLPSNTVAYSNPVRFPCIIVIIALTQWINFRPNVLHTNKNTQVAKLMPASFKRFQHIQLESSVLKGLTHSILVAGGIFERAGYSKKPRVTTDEEILTACRG